MKEYIFPLFATIFLICSIGLYSVNEIGVSMILAAICLLCVMLSFISDEGEGQ